MEKQSKLKTSPLHKRLYSSAVKDGKQNLLKKRPSTTKLDLEKIFQQSIELTQVFKKLSTQNNHLRLEHQKVQSAKSSRQALISMVQQIVKQKAKDLNKNPTNQSSWLVHKLNTKVYELKNKIEAKQKAIRQVEMSKESEWIRQKQCQMKALDELTQFLKTGKNSINSKKKQLAVDKVQQYEDFQEQSNEENSIMNGIKEIVWLQDEIKQKQDEVFQQENIYQEEQRQVKRIMMEIAKKKGELTQIRELQEEYYRTQQEFRQEKKKKEQRLAGNKTYLDELIQSRHNQLKKLQELKQKYQVIEEEQNKNISELQQKLEQMKIQYQQKMKAKQKKVQGTIVESTIYKKQKWVKRVTYKEVRHIARNLNYFLALKRVSKEALFKNIFKDQEKLLSIGEVIKILEQYPLQIQNQNDRQLLARYCIEDAGQGYFKEDMDTSQAVPIIRSVLSKLIGDVRIYDKQEETHLMKKTGELMHKFHSLIQQNMETKEGSIKKITKQIMEQAIIATELDLDSDEINFVILYLFSWTHNIDGLQIYLLEIMLDKGVRWITKSQNIN